VDLGECQDAGLIMSCEPVAERSNVNIVIVVATVPRYHQRTLTWWSYDPIVYECIVTIVGYVTVCGLWADYIYMDRSRFTTIKLRHSRLLEKLCSMNNEQD